MTPDTLYRLIVCIAQRNSPRTARQLLDRYPTAQEAIERHPEIFADKLPEARKRAEQELEFIQRHQIATYYYQDDHYPYRLAACVDAPLMLYAKGHVQVNPQHTVSVVGTRRATERGKDWCRRFVLDLAAQVPDLTIISGLAYGIDVAAHKAAIEAGIPTLIIPAHGLDRIYPATHRPVAVQALERGGILTEYPSGTEPERHHFVARNRIVAGMADALVVVESKARGGSLITAEMAVDYGREVFAVPGRAGEECSAGCNDMIKRQRAQLIEHADDLIQCMQWTTQPTQPVQTSMVEMMNPLSDLQIHLLQLLRLSEDGLHINQLVIETQCNYNVVSAELVMMELQDIVKSMPGGMWRAKK